MKTLHELTMNIAKRLVCFGKMMDEVPDFKKSMSYDVDNTSMRISTLYKSRVTFFKELSMKKAHMTINVSDKLSKEDRVIHNAKDDICQHEMAKIQSDIFSVPYEF